MSYDKLLLDEKECAVVSKVQITRGQNIYQEGVLVGKHPDLCQFNTVPVLSPALSLRGQLFLLDSSSKQTLAINTSEVDLKGNVKAIINDDEPPPW
jgi:hypothetical protein